MAARRLFSYEQTWTLETNFLDTVFGRYTTEGKIFQFHNYVGLRAAFIDQKQTNFYNANLVNGGSEVGVASSEVNTNSWGIGIRGGTDAQCKIGDGFRFYANGAGDLLYTHYNWHGVSNATIGTIVNWNSDVIQKDIATVRLHLEAELGFLWGIDLNCRNMTNPLRLDFSAGYGFQVFFDQNMFRHFTTAFEEIVTIPATIETVLSGVVASPISNSPNGNLYMQGLRLSASIQY